MPVPVPVPVPVPIRAKGKGQRAKKGTALRAGEARTESDKLDNLLESEGV